MKNYIVYYLGFGFLGAFIGIPISYWFMPSITRMAFSLPEYFQSVIAILFGNYTDPISPEEKAQLYMTLVVACGICGVIGVIVGHMVGHRTSKSARLT